MFRHLQTKSSTPLTPKAPPRPTLELDFRCGSTKSAFVIELAELGPGYIVQKLRTPAATAGNLAGFHAPGSGGRAAATRKDIPLKSVNFAGTNCPHCRVELYWTTICSACGTLVCPAAWTTYRAPDGGTRMWFACPCGEQGWGCEGPAQATILARTCESAPALQQRQAKSLPAPNLLRLPPPTK